MSGSAAVFSKYPNPVFIETGSHTGDGIQFAIDAGFQTIISKFSFLPMFYYN